MSLFSLQTNVLSMFAQRNLSGRTALLAQVSERLATGLRINHPSDDAAGLSIASSLDFDSRVYAQGVRNLNDGISLFTIADGALSSLSQIITRLQELAVQSANGTVSNKQRQALDKEAQALAKEYSRIARTTTFNGRNLFDADSGTLSLQIGYDNLASGLGGAVSDGNFTRVSYSVGTQPRDVAVGDFNGDGVPDLATADNAVSVLLGRGDGTFAPSASYAAGNTPFSITTGDFNRDGQSDLAVAATNDDAVDVLLGRGDGTFAPSTSYAAGISPRSVTVGDFNGDGVPDLAAADFSSNSISVLLGRGDGTFNSRASYATGSNPHSVAVGDFNGDGVEDIATAATNDDAVDVLLGRGDGTFAPSTSYAAGSNPRSVTVGDFNGDGVPDLVSADANDGTTSVLLGRGDGTFNSRASYAVGMAPHSVTVGDFNGDGVEDIAAADISSGSVSVLSADTRDGVSALLPFSLATRESSLDAMTGLSQAEARMSAHRGQLGALQTRVGSAISLLRTTTENLLSAKSQITDADIGEEAAQETKNRILQNIAAAILSQANQIPELVLKLLTAPGVA